MYYKVKAKYIVQEAHSQYLGVIYKCALCKTWSEITLSVMASGAFKLAGFMI